jgi:hypothetical protein
LNDTGSASLCSGAMSKGNMCICSPSVELKLLSRNCLYFLIHPRICLCVYVCMHAYVCVRMYLFICPSIIHPFDCLPTCLPVSLYTFLSIYPSVYLPVCL